MTRDRSSTSPLRLPGVARALSCGALAIAALVASPPRAEAAKPVVAVFDIYDARPKGKFSNDELGQLNTYLLARLAEVQVYNVVPREQVLAAISSTKKDTYKACYDEKCQIELGKELAAEKSLGTQIIRIGDKCVVTSTLYDLRTAVSDGAATKRTACEQGGILDALDAIVEQLSAKAGGAVKVATNAEKALGDLKKEEGKKEGDGNALGQGDKRPEKKEPDRVVLPETKPSPFASTALPNTSDGQLCLANDGNACSRVAKEYAEAGQPLVGWKAADRGCNLGHSICCQWAAKIAADENDKLRALEYARTGCNLRDGGGCSWTAKFENEVGSKERALEAAKTGCYELSHGGSCAWGANIEFNRGNKPTSLEWAKKGCSYSDGEACSWIIKINYEGGNRPAALEAARSACDNLKHAASCSWAATISYENGDKAKALDFSTRGCELGEVEACGWNTKIQYELGNKQRALEVGARACNTLNHPASCSWAASIEYELGNKQRALAYATHGCNYNGKDACGWRDKIQAEGVR